MTFHRHYWQYNEKEPWKRWCKCGIQQELRLTRGKEYIQEEKP